MQSQTLQDEITIQDHTHTHNIRKPIYVVLDLLAFIFLEFIAVTKLIFVFFLPSFICSHHACAMQQ